MQLLFTVTARDDGQRLNVFLRKNGLSMTLIKKIKYLPDGILVNGQRRHTDRLLKAGEMVQVRTDSGRAGMVQPQSGPLDIVYEDSCCMVVNKPRGMACHPSLNCRTDTLANFFAGYWQDRGESRRCRIINRLDKNTSGLVLIALNAYSARCLSSQTDKLYTAVVKGSLSPSSGKIDLPIGRRENSIITRCVRPDGQRAVTCYETAAVGGGYSLMKIKLLTGRTHQIRVHFSHIGHPLAGDGLYGGDTQLIGRHALHCARMNFISPETGKTVEVCAGLPRDMKSLATKLHICETLNRL